MTEITFQWIYHNGYELEFSDAKNVDELKKMVKVKMNPITDSFAKGARLVKWDVVFKVLTRK